MSELSIDQLIADTKAQTSNPQQLSKRLKKRNDIQTEIGLAIKAGKPWRCIAEKYDPDFFATADLVLSVANNRIYDYRESFLSRRQARAQNQTRVR